MVIKIDCFLRIYVRAYVFGTIFVSQMVVQLRSCSRTSAIKGRRILQRQSTLLYEFSKSLGNLPKDCEEMTEEEVALRKKLLNNDGKCEYCEKREHSTLDHFFPLVKGSFPTDACNDTWNLVPACKECNSSKGGKTIEEWCRGGGEKNPLAKGKNPEIIAKLLKYQEYANKYRYRKTFNVHKMQCAIDTCQKYLKSLDDMVHDIQMSTRYLKGI